MGQQWSRVVNSTIKKYIREREVNTLRNRKLSALLKKRGQISFGWDGLAMNWRVKYRRVRLTPYDDGDTLIFDRKDRNKTAELDYRGYSATDAISKKEFLMNRNAEAIVKLFSGMSDDLMEDMEDAFGEELYVNGYLSGNEKRIHGIESFMSATTNVGNGAGLPTGSYAGLSCVPGAVGGNWVSGNLPGWPNGYGDAHYDYWSPLIVDYGDTLFDPSTHTWANNCVEAISFAIIKTKKNKSQKGQLDVILTDDEMYRQYLKVMRAKERILVENQNRSDLIKLGFSDVVNQDGTDVTWEFGIPNGVGYGFNIDMMELRSMQAQVFVPEGPNFDDSTKTWRFSVDFFGNATFNPKFFCKLINLTNPSDAA